MKATMTIPNPDDIHATLTVTMSIRDWKKLRAIIGNDHPGWKFNAAIAELVDKIGGHYAVEDVQVGEGRRF